MNRSDVESLIVFLSRVVARGAEEEEQLCRLVQLLESSLWKSRISAPA